MARINPGNWCVVAQLSGFYFNMTYTIVIDQTFAEANELSLVQVATLAAFMTLPTWTKNIAIDGHVWYLYSDEKMAEDFPLLFGVAKRCYKNLNDLADMGFVQLTKLGRNKYVRFTERCQDWGKEKIPNWTESPKTDQLKSENGLNESPKMDSNYNINNTNSIRTISAVGGLFPETVIVPEKDKRGTSENLCLFANSRYSDYEQFAKCFSAPEFAEIDINYYFHAVSDWSAQHGKKMHDWIATARNFIRGDMKKGCVHKLNNDTGGLTPDAIKYLHDCAEGL